jgi:hypothetical protein
MDTRVKPAYDGCAYGMRLSISPFPRQLPRNRNQHVQPSAPPRRATALLLDLHIDILDGRLGGFGGTGRQADRRIAAAAPRPAACRQRADRKPLAEVGYGALGVNRGAVPVLIGLRVFRALGCGLRMVFEGSRSVPPRCLKAWSALPGTWRTAISRRCLSPSSQLRWQTPIVGPDGYPSTPANGEPRQPPALRHRIPPRATSVPATPL